MKQIILDLKTGIVSSRIEEDDIDASSWIDGTGVLISRNQASVILEALELLEQASNLVGNSATNISSSVDLACDSWQEKYKELTK